MQWIIFGLLLTAIAWGSSSLTIKVNQPGMLILEFEIDSIFVENDSIIITKPALPLEQSAGYPQIPCRTEVVLGLPGTALIEVFADQPTIIHEYTPTRAPEEHAKGIDYSVSFTPWDGSDYPDQLVQLTPAGKIRGHESSSLKIFPARIISGNLVWHRHITIKLSWSKPTSLSPQLLSQSKLSEIPIRRTPIPLNRQTVIPDYQYSANIAKITLNKTGWYQLTYSTLADSGLSISGVDPRSFRLWNQAREILIYVEGESDSVFNSEDKIIFFGEKNAATENAPYRNNFYTSQNVYWLTWGAEHGIRYVSESAYPDLPENQVLIPLSYTYTEHYEQDNYFARLGSMQTHEQWDAFDHFFMEPPINGGTSERFEIELYQPRNTNNVEFQVNLEFQGITDGNHSLQAFINGYKVADGNWSGQESFQVTEDPNQVLQNDFLNNGANELLITLEGRYDQVYLNWIEITYDRLYQAHEDQIVFTRDSNLPITTQFEVSGFSNNFILVFKEGVSRIQDFVVIHDSGSDHYKVVFQDYFNSNTTKYHCLIEDSLLPVNSLHTVDPVLVPLRQGGADYLIIMPDSFSTVLEPLINLHNGVGVNIDDIYRQYSSGVLSPYAIRDFLADVYYHWNPIPSTVLIAMQGGWFGWSGGYSNPDSYIPSMKMQTYGWGAASSDFWYTLVDGEDLIPEFAIGRLPARNTTELELMVQKTLDMQTAEQQTWQNQVLMIAGYEEAFKIQSESLIRNIITEGIFPARLNIDKYSEGGPFYGSTDTLVNHFADGRVYINFLGHGGGAVWGDRSLFTLGDVDNLSNPGKTPFVTSMTCFTGDVTNPNALGRQLMGYDQGGVVGWFGSAGVGWIINDYLLLQPIHQRLFNSPELSIGDIINQAKIQYFATNTSYPDIARSQVFQFNLSGDPAMILPLPTKTSIQLTPRDPEPGETIKITLSQISSDSLRVQLFDDNRIPTTRYPQLMQPISGSQYNYPLSTSLISDNYNLICSWKSNGSSFRSCSPISISGTNITFNEIIPADPSYLDSIQVIVQAIDRQGVDSVQLLINGSYFANMVPFGNNLYQLNTLISPQSAGSQLTLHSRVVDNTGQLSLSLERQIVIRRLPEFTVNNISILVDNNIQLACIVDNSSSGSGNAIILFERFISDDWEPIGADTIAFAGRGKLRAIVLCALISGINEYRASVRSDFSGSTVDTTTGFLVTTAFWVTPQLGTTTDLQTHSLVSFAGIELEISPGSTATPFPIRFQECNSIDLPYQPDLKPVLIDTTRLGIELLAPSTIPITATWSLNNRLPDTVALYQYFSDREIWLPVINSSFIDSFVTFQSTAPGRWAFLTSTDAKPPQLEATINGQRFLHNSYLNSRPVISLIGQDNNGIDHRPSTFQVWINDQKLTSPKISVMSGRTNQIGIQFTPTLTRIDTSMAMVVQDASGNTSDTLKLKFIVSEKLNLIDYGNFPNPFADQTRFAYELTETVDEFSLNIYTVAGRRIRHLTQGSTLTDLDPRVGAYHEIIWDGRDKNGEFVANGVYFYQIKIKKGKTVIERRGKIAKAR